MLARTTCPIFNATFDSSIFGDLSECKMKKDLHVGDLLSVKVNRPTGFVIALGEGFKGFWAFITGRFIATHSCTVYRSHASFFVDMADFPNAYQIPLNKYLKLLKKQGSKYRIRRVGHLANSSLIKMYIRENLNTPYEPIGELALTAIDLNQNDVNTMMCSERYVRNQKQAGAGWCKGINPEHITPAELDVKAKKVARKCKR
jgi:hypothetical protein